MVEVMISAVLFIVAASGILATIVQTRKPAVDSDENAKAAMFSQKISESLRANIGSDTWTSSAWSTGSHTVATDSEFPGYSATYDVTNLADGGKQVLINVTY